jgi:putative ABC transport system permease protein
MLVAASVRGLFAAQLSAEDLITTSFWHRFHFDSRVFVFLIALTFVTNLLAGLAPALQAARPGLQGTLKESGRGTTEGRGGLRLRSALVVAEIALALVTLVGAGLMLRSFVRLAAIDPGFDSHNVLTLVVSLDGQPEMIGEKREAFYQQLLEKISAFPSVTSASAINHLPLAGDTWGWGISIEGRPFAKPGEGLRAVYRVCRPAYFQTMGISLVRGRDFTTQDKSDTPGVAIINEQLARQQWPGEDPVGKRLTLDDPRNIPKWLTIVGVLKNVKQSSWIDDAGDEVYVPFGQSRFFSDAAGHLSAMTLVVRTASSPLGLASAVQEAVWSLNQSAPISSVTTLEEVVSNTVWQPRFNLVLIALFAGLALTLAIVGIYGVIACAVTQRTHEIGIRMALGAQRYDVLRLVISRGMTLTLIGTALGVLGSLGLTRLMTNLLYEVQPTDPLTFTGVSLLLAGIALLACWLPARRAARVDPMEALRYE